MSSAEEPDQTEPAAPRADPSLRASPVGGDGRRKRRGNNAPRSLYAAAKSSALLLVGGLGFFAFVSFASGRPFDPVETALSEAGSLAVTALALGGFWREQRYPSRQTQLAPSVWAGALGGAIGGALAGALFAVLYLRSEGVSEDTWSASLFAKIFLYGTLSGAVSGTLIQVGCVLCGMIRARAAKPYTYALRGLRECSGGLLGGVTGGALCGALGGLYFGPDQFHGVVSMLELFIAGAFGSVCIACCITGFDYAGKFGAVVGPLFLGTAIAGTLTGLCTVAILRVTPRDHGCWAWQVSHERYLSLRAKGRVLDPPTPPKLPALRMLFCRLPVQLSFYAPAADHARAGIVMGLPSGGALGLQVGLVLLVAQLRKQRQ